VLDEMSRAIAEHAAQRPEPASARLVRRAVQLIENGEGRVESVASELGVTPRHLRRAFAEGIGVGPKDFARGVRLRRAIALSTTSHDWARIAADAGFYDQAHLIAEFKSLVGLTPGAFLKRQSRTAATAQQAA
jgi:AraC-like DNA-binding protein